MPDRYKEGYGISINGINFAKEKGINLIIALDCGIKAVENVRYANENKIDFIICDHHKPGIELPNAVAILNPKKVIVIIHLKIYVGVELAQISSSTVYAMGHKFRYSN